MSMLHRSDNDGLDLTMLADTARSPTMLVAAVTTESTKSMFDALLIIQRIAHLDWLNMLPVNIA